MPYPSSITPAAVSEVARRRAAGEPWKLILTDMARRGLPAGRTRWFHVLRDVSEHQNACADRPEPCTPG